VTCPNVNPYFELPPGVAWKSETIPPPPPGTFDLVQACAACPTVLFTELAARRHMRLTGHRVMGRLQFKKVLPPIEDLP